MAEGEVCIVMLPLAISLQEFIAPCPTVDYHKKSKNLKIVLQLNQRLTWSLVLTTSKGQVTVVPAAPASLIARHIIKECHQISGSALYSLTLQQ